jgi:hypothetical protein
MLVIRAEQMKVLAQSVLKRWIEAHLLRCFPAQCAALGDAGWRAAVTSGMEQALRHGFREPSDICRYVDLVIAFGPDFERRTEFDWTREILGDSEITNPSVRMNRLHAAAVRHLAPASPTTGER